METVHQTFPKIFNVGDIEDEENTLEKEEESSKRTNTGWGLLPLLLAICEKTNHTLEDVYNMSIMMSMYISTYIIEENEKKLKELNKIKKR